MSPQRDEPQRGAGLHRDGVPRVPRAQARHQPRRIHHERQHHTVLGDVHWELYFISEEDSGWTHRDLFLRIPPQRSQVCVQRYR